MTKKTPLREEVIALLANLKANPIVPETNENIRLFQLELVEKVSDQLLDSPLLGPQLWDIIDGDLCQLFLLAGFDAIGEALSLVQTNHTERMAAEATPDMFGNEEAPQNVR